MTYRSPINENVDGSTSAPAAGDYGFNDNILNKQSSYNFTHLAFPSDIGQENNGHYMVININVPVPNATGTVRASAFNNFYSTIETEYSKLDRLSGLNAGQAIPGAFSLTAPFGKLDPAGAVQTQNFVPRGTRRIKESIALFMPGPLVFSTKHTYEDISLTGLFQGIAASAIQGIGSTIPSAAGQIMSKVGASAVEGIQTAAKLAGSPINPRIEILFATTVQREFRFELLMAPRNLQESQAIKSIVRTLRFHAAPELTLGGFAFIPPAEFDITFYNKGVENTNMPRINTGVIEAIEVQYDPTGIYSTFSNGHPVAVRLSIGFRELEIGHKLRIAQGF